MSRGAWLLVLGWFALASSAPAALEWEKTTIFAAASPGDGKVLGHFPVKNTGSYPVKFTGFKTTCGCTAASAEKRVLAPGEAGEVIANFNTAGRRGLYEVPVTVKTDDPGAPESVVRFRVLVQEALTLQPTFLHWKADEPLTPKTIELQVTDGFSVKKIAASATDARFGVRIEARKAAGAFALVITPPATTERVSAKLHVTPDGAPPESKPFMAYLRVR